MPVNALITQVAEETLIGAGIPDAQITQAAVETLLRVVIPPRAPYYGPVGTGVVQFGTGVLYGLPNAGDLAPNPTPVKFGILQDITVEFKGDVKTLFSDSQFAVISARSKVQVVCKAKVGVLDPHMLNQLYFGQADDAGITILSFDEAVSIPTVTPFTIVASHSPTYATDYGVMSALTGLSWLKVDGPPDAGEYSLDTLTGTYTFNSGDAAEPLFISYAYQTASGSTITLANQPMGHAPEFRAFLYNVYRGTSVGIELYSCTLGQLSIATKQEDFWMCDLTFEASCDASNTLGGIYSNVN